jgi:hypothetical protein
MEAACRSGAPMVRGILIAATILLAAAAILGATVAPAAIAFDGYDHSYEDRAANASAGAEPGYGS